MTSEAIPLDPDLRAPSWQQQLKHAVRDVAELARLLELDPADLGGAAVGRDEPFPLRVPRSFVARMRKGDPNDPLLKQVLPVAAERIRRSGFGDDPLTEQQLARSGTIQKYPGRALLIATGVCPVHCRYCFRRAFPYSEQLAARDDWQPALAEIAKTPGVTEVILSGGDPLSLGNARLARLIRRLETVPGLTTLRIHTRYPIVLPDRVDPGLVSLLAATPLDVVVVVHANHAAEIDTSVASAAARLKSVTSLLLNQSVLLRGINDDVGALIALSRALSATGITPYYLHALDKVAGAAHFDVGRDEAAKLVREMRKRVSGYLVPRLVADIPNELSKTPLA